MTKETPFDGDAADGAAKHHVERGFERIGERSFDEAIAYFDEAISLEPRNGRAHYGRGLARHFSGELDDAVADYDRAIELDPQQFGAFLNRGSIRLQRGESEEALADYAEAIRLAPQDTSGYQLRAQAWMERQEYLKALADIESAIGQSPEDPRLHFQRGLARQELGDLEEARKAMDEAVRFDPRMAEAFRARGLLFQRLGAHNEAEENLERAGDLSRSASMTPQTETKRLPIARMLREHFAPGSTDDITITEREFPFRIRADLQRAIDSLFVATSKVLHFCGVKQHFSHEGIDFSDLIAPNPHQPAVSVPPQYDELDIGEEQPVRCLQNGLWFLEEGAQKFAVLLAPPGRHFATGIKFQIATINDKEGTRISQAFFKHLEDSVLRSESYRGKILSLEMKDRYSGQTSGLLVHRLRDVSREDVILPRKTLALLDRNVIDFTRHRSKLAKYGLSTKKGILFYGPPGTGKTHTIHYLARALEGHTTFLISAEQVGALGEYMTLARLLQPSVVVIEDVDLIARDRNSMGSACEEVLLNKLLNEMDGLRPDADVLFILTTNRPESLERALASRPGRVDQAIEFPLPDDEGREKLIRLYSQGMFVPDDVIRETVKKTERVSASFIKELMRRAAQFQIERGAETPDITQADIDAALDELLFSGGSLNRKLLGAEIEG